VSNEYYISEDITEAFEVTKCYLWMIDFGEIYTKVIKAIPPRNISFSKLPLEIAIGCEVVCAAICHQMNWDYLRTAVYKMTLQDDTWIIPKKLSRISSIKVSQLLSEYDKPERIREKERCSLLRSLGRNLIALDYNYSDIFLTNSSNIRNFEEIIAILNSFKVFSRDPEGKKIQLLLQNLSDYVELTALRSYCKPAIDYHIIREFLRRGLVKPINQKANDYIFNPEVQRREQTVAALRMICSEAFGTLKWLTSYDITTINTVEWWIGRSVCLKECPDCELKTDSSQWLKPNFERCPFYDSCYAIQFDKKFLNIVEPNYQGNSY